MKTALVLFLSILTLPAFSQSKKATNKLLLEKQAQLVRQNDSLTGVITANHQKLTELGKASHKASRNLIDRRMTFAALKRDIEREQRKLVALGANPNIEVPQLELDEIFARYNEADDQKEVKEFGIGRQPISIKKIGDISQEKLKVRNELLAQKNQEYSLAIDSNLRIIEHQEMRESTGKTAVQKMEAASTVLIKDNRLLKEKYELLSSRRSELELKKELAAAENAKKESVEKPAPKKKRKEKTVSFIPPVVIDKDIDYPSNWEGNENASDRELGFSDPPPPVMKEEKMMEQGPVIHEIVDEPASFPGGREALSKYLQENIIYPQIAREAEITGKVYVKFVVSDLGAISNVKIMRGIPGCKECDQEAIRVVKAMPKWVPGKNSGKAVNSYYNLPVPFKL